MTAATDAAARLLSALPVHTHYQDRGPDRGENMRRTLQGMEKRKPTAANPAKKKLVTGRGQGGLNAKAIRISGKVYPTVRAARLARKVGYGTINRWLAEGRASYET